MPRSPTQTVTLRYQGLFDFEGLYGALISFFTSKEYDYIEKLWKEKEASPEGREITVKMAPEKKVTEYIMHVYAIEWKSIDVHPVEIVRNGKPVKLIHARFHIIIKAELNVDWQSLGDTSPKLGAFWKDHVFKRELWGVYYPNLQMEAQQLMDHLKQYLHMEMTRYNKGEAHA